MLLTQFNIDLAKCMGCAPPVNGKRPCPYSSVNIHEHARAGYCAHPDGPRFGDGNKPAEWGVMMMLALPAALIPADTSPEQERRRAQAGGCCGEPSA